MSARRLDSSGLREWAHAAVGGLVVHAEEINRLNVFPVADADTGTNMLFTMRSAVEEANEWSLRPDGAGDVAQLAGALARGALHGARGNSGVILSQILRGLAEVTASAEADTEGGLGDIDATLLGASLRHAAGLAVASMGETVAGTIVSVLEAAAGAVERSAADGDDLADAVVSGTDAAAAALEKTPEQLDVLADAGVVDAGGRGLLVLLDALTSTLTGHTTSRREYLPSPVADTPAAGDEPPPQFEVMYQLSGCCDPARVDQLRERLESLGESVAIAGGGGDRHSVHVHTDDAGAAVEAALAVGTPSQIQITALSAGGPPGRWTRRRAVLAVVDGDGAEELFRGEGAHVLRPEPGAAVSAKQLLRAFVDTGAGQIIVLPNGYVAAEELVAGCTAATGRGLDVVPVPTGSMVQGLAALAVHEPGHAAVDDGYTMTRAAGATRQASARLATERALTWAGTCEPGDGLGIANDEVLVVGEDIASAATELLDLLLAAGGELVTVLIGAGVDDSVGAILDEHVRRHHLGTEIVTYHTGHRGDPLLIGVE